MALIYFQVFCKLVLFVSLNLTPYTNQEQYIVYAVYRQAPDGRARPATETLAGGGGHQHSGREGEDRGAAESAVPRPRDLGGLPAV